MTFTFSGVVLVVMALLSIPFYFAYKRKPRSTMVGILVAAICIPVFVFQTLGQPYPLQYDWQQRFVGKGSQLIAAKNVEGVGTYLWIIPPGETSVIYNVFLDWDLRTANLVQKKIQEMNQEGEGTGGTGMGNPTFIQPSMDKSPPKMWETPQPASPPKTVPKPQ